MTTRKKKQFVKPTKPNKKVARIPENVLAELMELHQEGEVAKATSQMLGAKFNHILANQLKSLGMPIQESAVCFHCGTVRLRTVTVCPEKSCPSNA